MQSVRKPDSYNGKIYGKMSFERAIERGKDIEKEFNINVTDPY